MKRLFIVGAVLVASAAASAQWIGGASIGSSADASALCRVAGGSLCRLSVSALAGTTPSIDFSSATKFTLTTSGATTFAASSNIAAGAEAEIAITGGGAHNLSFPSWTWIGTAAPTAIANGKDMLISIACYGATEQSCLAGYAVEP